MTLARVQTWYNRIPAAERNLPLLIVDGRAYTPSQALAEVRMGTPVGRRLQELIESGRYGTTPEEEAILAKERLKQIFRRLPPGRPIVATLGRTFTPEQMMAEIEAETPLGREYLRAEMEKMRRIVSIR